MESSFYPYIIAFSWIGFFLLLGTYLRAKVKFFQKMLFPASLIGGLLGFIMLNLGLVGMPTSQGWQTIEPQVFSMIVFHLFAIGFVGIGLLKANAAKKEAQAGNVKGTLMRGALWFCCLSLLIRCVQSLSGYGVFELFNFLGFDISPINGYLLGFKGGQAQAFGSMWELNNNIAYSISSGLGFVAFGYLASGIVGSLLISYGIKKGWHNTNNEELSNEFLTGILSNNNQIACAHSTTHTSNIDSFSFHFAIFTTLYGLSYLISVVWTMYMPPIFAPLGFTLTFVWAMILGTLVKRVSIRRNFNHIFDQESIRRITNITIDLMLCAVFLGIEMSDITQILVPFLSACFIALFLTLFICLYMGRRTTEYAFERMVALFGMSLGSTASGLLLLRIVDPDLKTPIPTEIAVMSLVGLLYNLPLSWAKPFIPIEGFPFNLVLLAYIITMPLYLVYKKIIQTKKVF